MMLSILASTDNQVKPRTPIRYDDFELPPNAYGKHREGEGNVLYSQDNEHTIESSAAVDLPNVEVDFTGFPEAVRHAPMTAAEKKERISDLQAKLPSWNVEASPRAQTRRRTSHSSQDAAVFETVRRDSFASTSPKVRLGLLLIVIMVELTRNSQVTSARPLRRSLRDGINGPKTYAQKE